MELLINVCLDNYFVLPEMHHREQRGEGEKREMRCLCLRGGREVDG